MGKMRDALRRLELTENAFMRDLGWAPYDAERPWDDWTPPEDRENLWDRERALEECKWRCVKETP